MGVIKFDENLLRYWGAHASSRRYIGGIGKVSLLARKEKCVI